MSDKKVENLIINKLTKEQYKSLENKSDTELYIITDEEHLTSDEVQDLLQKKVDKVEGKSLIADTEIERLSKVDNYDDTEVKQDIETNKNNIEKNSENIQSNTENISKNASDISSLQTNITDLQNNKQDKLTAGTGIEIIDNVISNTQTSAEWGNIKGDITQQSDLSTALNDLNTTLNDLNTALGNKSNIDETGNKLAYNNHVLSLQDKNGNTLSGVTIHSEISYEVLKDVIIDLPDNEE